ncbi:response regulator [Fusibacter bizertensis]
MRKGRNSNKPTISFKIIISICLIFIVIAPFGFAADSSIIFTPEEKEFISTHPIIHLGIDPTFVPYEFIDKDGIYKGIASDYLDLISVQTGLKFEVEQGITWASAYEKAVKKELDALPCISKTKEREKYFLFSEPYYQFKRAIFINENNTAIKGFEDLHNRKVAVQINSSHYSFLKDFPDIELSLYTTVEEALQAVSDGKEEAFIGNYATSSYLSKSEGITNLVYMPIETGEKQYLYFATRNDWPLLQSIINKALETITEEQKINIDNRWIGVSNKLDYGEIIKWASIVSAVVLLVFVVSLYWIVKLRKEIKKRIQIEAELKVAKEEAELANHVKSSFLARMSHEIRTPLNAITGMSYIIKKTDLSSVQKIYLDKITRAAKDMLSIINDILDFSKIEAGKIELEHISFNLDEILEQLVNIVSFRIEEQKIDFSMHKDKEIPQYFIGDPKRIEQILLNLVNNAIKFTSDGAVTVSIRLVARVRDTYTLEFSVKDTGIGMTSDQRERLFVPFEQADASITRRFGGTGLGLPIVKNLVDIMDGKIDVYSEQGEGSTFNVQISLESDRNKDYEDRKKQASIYFRNIRVLVLEKSLFYRNLLIDYLDSFNIVAEFAQSEAHVINLILQEAEAKDKPYNLLIIDSETPLEGGIAFYDSMKGRIKTEYLPKTILLIPQSKEDLFDKLEEHGLDLGVSKPIVPSILYNGILEIFRKDVLGEYERTVISDENERLIVENPYHLLIVEDNMTNQFIAQSILEQAGFVVNLAANGKEGYELFARNREKYHAILMDLHMPVMNGFESASLIRKIDQNIPIIAMTADAIAGVEEQCSKVGINHYISKPFEPEQFIKTIYEVVNAHVKLNASIGETVHTERYAVEMEPDIETETAIESNQDISVIDTATGIRNVGGNAELYGLILKEYLKENKDVSLILNKAINENDYATAIQIVHKIKSSTGSIGAKSLHLAASELQKALTDNEVETVQRLSRVFNKLLKKVLVEIEERLV